MRAAIAKMYLGSWSGFKAIMMEYFGKDLTPQLDIKTKTPQRALPRMAPERLEEYDIDAGVLYCSSISTHASSMASITTFLLLTGV